MVGKNVPWEEQQAVKEGAKPRLSMKRSCLPVSLDRGSRARFGELTIWADSVIVKHNRLLSLEGRGAAVAAS